MWSIGMTPFCVFQPKVWPRSCVAIHNADPAHRPTQAQYERYIWLVQTFRNLNWDNSKLHDAPPFQIVYPGFNGILLRAVSEVAALASELGETKIAQHLWRSWTVELTH